MNITEFIQLLADIKQLNPQDKVAVDQHLNNLNTKPVAIDKLQEAMDYVKGLVMMKDPNRKFPEKFANIDSVDFSQVCAQDLIDNENALAKTPKVSDHSIFKANNSTQVKKGWELSCCDMVMLGCIPVIGWAILLGYAIYQNCSTPENGVPQPQPK